MHTCPVLLEIVQRCVINIENATCAHFVPGNLFQRFLNGSHSPAVPYTDLPRDEPERVKSSVGSSAAQSRRAKNAAHRADDVGR